ncbi:MAG: T9SS type A sorting domain-containing protein [Candidatus Krumholzibacteriota bacterium]|nr:T9SS type A sorting domain-containing protein [Candidatus Krumholzibacteriota bacterium]
MRLSDIVKAAPVMLAMALISLPAGALPSSAEKESARINRINLLIKEKGYHWTAGTTSVSNLSREEKMKLTGFIPPSEKEWNALPLFLPSAADVDDPVFDWRTNEGTTPARDQGPVCGSCWAFAAVGQLEGHARIYDRKILDLSEQQLIDCNTFGDDCDGGNHWHAYEIFRDYGAVDEGCIPYRESDGFACRQESCEIHARIGGYSVVKNNVFSIKQALLKGPVATVLYVDDLFHDYVDGCYDVDNMLYEPDHAVLIVGWDDTQCGGQGAWICKNSWGTDWGIDGFFYIKYEVSWIGYYSAQISYLPTVVHKYPNGGEMLYAGEYCEISWTTGAPVPDSVSIHLSLDGGVNFDTALKTGLRGVSSYSWKIPDLRNDQAVIGITTYVADAVTGWDAGDGPFTISLKNSLHQNFPNPFNGTTTIAYSLREPGRVKIVIYDISGNLIKTLRTGDQPAGYYETSWDGRDQRNREVSSGIYLCRVEAGSFEETIKIVYLK